MKLAIMQPYIFPYIGYYQLVGAVDKFIIYDDVTFIKQGWINRNNILINNEPFLFTIPLEKASSFTLIKDTYLNHKFYPDWRDKFMRTLEQNYKKAPFFKEAMECISSILFAECVSIAELASNSIITVSNFINLHTNFVESSTIYDNSILKNQERILDICFKEKADQYINPIGGQELYSKSIFAENNVELFFLKSKSISYKQFKEEKFIPWLSIIDVLMFVDKLEILELINQYDLI